MKQTKKKSNNVDIKKIFKTIASLKLTVICLIILTLIVVWGTLYQTEHGLYQAQQKFFHSWFFFILDFIPFPGTVLVLFVLFINLLASLFFRIGFRLANIGNIITHTGILILLVGGFFSFYFSEESTLMLKEGETGSMSVSRHLWEVSLREQGSGDIFAVDTLGLRPGEILNFPDLALQLQVKEYYENCTTAPAAAGMSGPLYNSSGIQGLTNKQRATDATDNIAGIVFEVQPSAAEKRTVLLYGRDPDPTMVNMDNRLIFFSLSRKKIPLPLMVKLEDFKVAFYPNSDIPRSYESRVRIKTDDGIERDVLISMNKPLRYRDLTLFQSSYIIDRDGSEFTILAVVRNVGRPLPYIASLWIFLGLLIHFPVKLALNRTRKANGFKGEQS